MGEQSWGVVMLNLFLYYGIPVLLIVVGFVAGRILEARHLRGLLERESKLRLAVPTNVKSLPPDRRVARSFLVTGSVVIASDYYKTLGAKLKSLVGGRLGTLETLVERGRREAVMRMREQAAAHGAHMVYNVRLETSTIRRSERRSAKPCVEVLAYGTAVVFAR